MSLSIIAETYKFEEDDPELIDNDNQLFEAIFEGDHLVTKNIQLENASGEVLPTSEVQNGEVYMGEFNVNGRNKITSKQKTKRTGNGTWTSTSQRTLRPRRESAPRIETAQNHSNMDTAMASASHPLPDEEKPEPFKCPFCLEINLGREGLIEHLRIVHKVHTPDQPASEVTQQASDEELISDKVLLSNGNEDNHCQATIKKKANTKGGASSSQQYQCRVCGLSVVSTQSLRRHMKIHRKNGRPLKCPKCKSYFKTASHLSVHLRTIHKASNPVGPKPIPKISINGKVISNNVILSNGDEEDTEMALQKGASSPPPTNECHVCNLTLFSSKNLKRHVRHHKMKVHNNFGIPWKCSKCNSFFIEARHLRQHETQVHKRKPGSSTNPCKICRKDIHPSKLTIHLNRVHGEDMPTLLLESSAPEPKNLNKIERVKEIEMPTLLQEPSVPENVTIINHDRNAARKQNAKDNKTTQAEIANIHASNSTILRGRNVKKLSVRQRNLRKVASVRNYKCNICGFSTANPNNLPRHMIVHQEEADRPWKCEQCSSFFMTENMLRLHENKLHNRTPGATTFPCRFCGKKFNRSRLLIHIRIHTQQRPFKCPPCGKLFRQIVHLQGHLRAVHGNEIVYEELKSSSQYQNSGSDVDNVNQLMEESKEGSKTLLTSVKSSHPKDIKIVNPDADINQAFKCPYCLAVFIENGKFVEHLLTHTTKIGYNSSTKHEISSSQDVKVEKPQNKNGNGFKYKCNVCKLQFEGKGRIGRASLLRHMAIHRETSRPWKCNRCSSYFLAPSQLRVHETRVHNRKPGPSKCICNVCGKRSRSPSELVAHMRIHNGDRPYACTKCGNKFRLFQHLKIHLQTHTVKMESGTSNSSPDVKVEEHHQPQNQDRGIFRSKCELCNLSFQGKNKKFDFFRHMPIHWETNRPWKCSQCSSYFLRASNLRVHETRVHNRKPGPSQSNCNICGKKMGNLTQLAVHMRIHTGERPFGCNICKHRCRQLGHLKRHLKIVHSVERSTSELKILASTKPTLNDFPTQRNPPNLDQLRPRPCQIILSRCDAHDNPRESPSIVNKTMSGGKAKANNAPKKFANFESSIRIRKLAGRLVYECKTCRKSFKHKSSVARHQLVHGQHEPIICELCSKSFSNNWSLKRHRRRANH